MMNGEDNTAFRYKMRDTVKVLNEDVIFIGTPQPTIKIARCSCSALNVNTNGWDHRAMVHLLLHSSLMLHQRQTDKGLTIWYRSYAGNTTVIILKHYIPLRHIIVVEQLVNPNYFLLD